MSIQLTIDSERCKGCLLCIEVCAHKVLAVARPLNSRGQRVVEAVNEDDCTGCSDCATICPDAAIGIEKEDD